MRYFKAAIFSIFINSFRQAQANDANNRLKDNETALRTDISLSLLPSDVENSHSCQ